MAALLDTHALYWLVNAVKPLANGALVAIAEAQAVDRLYVSPATAWELGVAAGKPPRADRPDLGDLPASRWFREAMIVTGARLVPIHQKIALEAAEVVARTGHKDPGDCFLIATARVRRLPIITRDRVMRDLAAADPTYLSVIEC